jgi:hypothetical protein
MPRQVVFTSNAAKPPATYSQAAKAAGLVFVFGDRAARSRDGGDQGHHDSRADPPMPHEYLRNPGGRRQFDGQGRQRHDHPGG